MPLPVYPVDAAGLAVLPNEATHEAREARWDWAVSLVEASMLKTNDSLLAEDLSVCDVVEHTVDYHLDGGHVLLANAAFYRYEMHNIRPPPALCVDIPDEHDLAPRISAPRPIARRRARTGIRPLTRRASNATLRRFGAAPGRRAPAFPTPTRTRAA